MIVLVLGANNSGKSLYAEELAARLSTGALYYIATMIPYGKDGQARVVKHRTQRATKGFVTIESPFCVAKTPLLPGAVVLLEDASNLLSNGLFGSTPKKDENSIFTDIINICAKCQDAVIVSIDGLSATLEYDEETNYYIKALNRLNRRLFNFADRAVIMRGGKPNLLKGEGYELD